MAEWDLVVVGCGVSGASFAHFAVRRGRKVLILEKAAVPGGSFATHDFGGGFWVELGAHTIYSSYAGFITVMEDLGLTGDVVARVKAPYRVCAGGRVVSIASRVRLLEAARYLPNYLLRRPAKAGRSVREYYSGVLGPSNYERLFGPVLRAVISQSPDGFPAETLLKRRPRNPSYPRSFTLRRGLRSFVDAAASQPGVTLRSGAEVIGVARSGGGFSVTLEGGEVVRAARVCLATPSPVTAALLAGVDLEAGALVSRAAPGETVESLGIAAPKIAVGIPPFAFVIADGETFSSVVSRDVVRHPGRRGFTVHFPGPGATRDEKLARARELLGMGSEGMEVAVVTHVAPRLAVGHRERIAGLDAQMRRNEGLFIVGNYFDGLAIEDCVQRARTEAARL